MALERKDNIGDTTASTGTGTINLAAVAQTGARIFAGNVTSGSTVRYDIRTEDESAWEIGEGVFTDGSPDTLTRVTVYASSNAGSLVNFSSGTKNVSLVHTAKDNDISVDIHAATEKTTPADADELGLIDSAASYVLEKLTVLGLKLAIYAGIKPAEGTMWNGKLAVEGAAGDLIIRLQTFAGSTPSDSDPIYITLGGAVRTINTQIDIVISAGTNKCNAGSSELATKEIDYFAYLCLDNTNVVALGASRIPSACLYSDFSSTATNEKYLMYDSAQYTPNSTDVVTVIGRFAATLSAGAGYTWSVPTYTAKNLIQRPIYETRWLTVGITANVSTGMDNGSGGQPTIVEARYKITGNKYEYHFNLSGTKATTTDSIGINAAGLFPIANNSNDSCVGATFCYAGAIFIGAVQYYGSYYTASFETTIADNTVIRGLGMSGSYEI